MLTISSPAQRAILRDGQAVVVSEDTIRIIELTVSYLNSEIRVAYYRGTLHDDGSFEITDPNPIQVMLQGDDVAEVVNDQADPTSWVGDIKLRRVEQMLIDKNAFERTGVAITSEIKDQRVVGHRRVLTPWEFRKRFSFSERSTIEASSDPGIKTILGDLYTVQEVDLDDPATSLSLGYMISQGLLTEERMAEILA